MASPNLSRRAKTARSLAPVQRFLGASLGVLLASTVLLGAGACGTTRTLGAEPKDVASPTERALGERCRADDVGACGELGLFLLKSGTGEADRQRALVLLETACGRDHVASCLLLGQLYGSADEAPAVKRGAEILGRLCARPVAEACTSLGMLRERPAPSEARALYGRACLLGEARACERHAVLELADPRSGDRALAERELAMACKAGRITSCHEWALFGLRDESRREGALSLLRQACDAGYAPSCAAAARFFAPVIGTAPDCGRAMPFAQRGCALEPRACVLVDACRLGGGKSSSDERERARQRLGKACDAHEPLGCLYWAEASRGTASVEALRQAYQQLAQEGDAELRELASVRLSQLVLDETKVASEANQAIDGLRTACARRSAAACCAWAEVLEQDHWTRPDPDRAAKARAQACAAGRCCGRDPRPSVDETR